MGDRHVRRRQNARSRWVGFIDGKGKQIRDAAGAQSGVTVAAKLIHAARLKIESVQLKALPRAQLTAGVGILITNKCWPPIELVSLTIC